MYVRKLVKEYITYADWLLQNIFFSFSEIAFSLIFV